MSENNSDGEDNMNDGANNLSSGGGSNASGNHSNNNNNNNRGQKRSRNEEMIRLLIPSRVSIKTNRYIYIHKMHKQAKTFPLLTFGTHNQKHNRKQINYIERWKSLPFIAEVFTVLIKIVIF